MERPPLGLKPRYIAEAQRMQEIEEAVKRFMQAGKQPRPEWIEEYAELHARKKPKLPPQQQMPTPTKSFLDYIKSNATQIKAGDSNVNIYAWNGPVKTSYDEHDIYAAYNCDLTGGGE